MKRALLLTLIAMLCGSALLAQRSYRGGGRSFRSSSDASDCPRDIPQHSYVTPNWTNAPGFERDAFTFVRIRWSSDNWGRGNGDWTTDTPDSDLNLMYRLQQVTSLKVDPDGLFLGLTDKRLSRYPFIYIVEPGSLYLEADEVAALKKYLLNGGFLWLDDFWGESEWEGMAEDLKKVFPDRPWVELPLDHALYHGVFDIKAKGQVPNVRTGTESQYSGVTWERYDAREVHHRAIFDDKGRMMVLATHNSDNGDGWEWEGDNPYYFEHFAEKTAYPLAINVIYYVMTH